MMSTNRVIRANSWNWFFQLSNNISKGILFRCPTNSRIIEVSNYILFRLLLTPSKKQTVYKPFIKAIFKILPVFYHKNITTIKLFILWLASKQRKKFLRGKTKFIIFVWASLYKTMPWKYFTEIIYLVLDGIANKNLS